MKEIRLDASLESSLDWEIQEEGDLLWHLDFGFAVPKIYLNDQTAFYSRTVAIEHFLKIVKNRGLGVILYRGGLDVLERIVDPEASLFDKANMFADYLHRLASFLPDEIKAYCFFEAPVKGGKFAQLTSKDRFWHLHLSLEESKSPIGILLPQDEIFSEPIETALDALLLDHPEARLIPESRLNELWDGLDELCVIEETVSHRGKRQIQGFLAAGGKVRSRGI